MNIRGGKRIGIGLAAVLLAAAMAGCGDPPDPNKPVGFATWNGPDYDALTLLPPETALLIASHREKGSEVNYDAFFSSKMELSDGTTVEEARATQVREKVLNQGRSLPGTAALSPFPMDMTEIQESDLMRWVKTIYANGQVNIDTAPSYGARNFGPNSVEIMGFTTLPMDTRRCPIAVCPEGPGTDPQPFGIQGGMLHYLLPHYPPTDGPSAGLFRAGGTWKTRVPVYYPLKGLDSKMFTNCRFMLYVNHTLEGYRQGPDLVLARINYTFEGGFDSRDPEMAKRFPTDWGKYHIIVDRLVGQGSVVVDVGRGEILHRQETSRLEITEQHLLPPDPDRPDKTKDMDGHWDTSTKTITDKFTQQKQYPKAPTPPPMPPSP